MLNRTDYKLTRRENSLHECSPAETTMCTECCSEQGRILNYDGVTTMREGRLRMASPFLSAESERDPYPFNFVTRQLTKRRSFEEFAEFRAVVLFPYDMDLMSSNSPCHS